MQDLIILRYDEDRITLSARELHGFFEGADFNPVIFDHPQNKRPTKDYQITIEMAIRSILSKFTKFYYSILRNSTNIKSLTVVANEGR